MAPIQVMGEVSPLDPQHLFSALIAAASSDAQLIRNGTKQLQSWEKTPGYYSQLQVCSALVDTDSAPRQASSGEEIVGAGY